MQSMRNSVLSHVRIRVPMGKWCLGKDVKATKSFCQQLCTSIGTDHDVTMARVIELVKKSGKLDANKVTETADFQKDLSLDSLDRVELVMAFEEEFSVEIPDKEADGLKCCADVTKYIISRAKETTDRT